MRHRPLPRLGLALAFALALPLAARAELPPLLDRELFFGNPELTGAQLSPDGKWVAFLKPWKDTRNVWVKRLEDPYEKAHLVTADPKRPIPGFFWSRDSKYILFVQDRDGDENYNVFAVDPAAEPATGQEAPPARNLTAAKGARATIYEVPRKQPDVLYVGLNDRDAAWHDLYQVRLSTGERTLLHKNVERISGWTFDLEGKPRLAERSTERGDTEILRMDGEGFTKVAGCTVLESCGTVRFHQDGKRVYLETNHGAPDLSRLVLLDPATGKEELVESDPRKLVDFGQALFSEVTDELVATLYVDERTRYHFRDPAYAADFGLVSRKLPGKDLVVTSRSADEKLWILAATSDTDPGSTYLFDRASKTLTLQYQVREKLPRDQLAPMKAITYRSSDGLTIPAYLTLPRGVPPRGLPLVVFPHGGPWSRTTWGFHGYAQALANRGYAVLEPNFRGSTGYGKRFLDAGNGQWGEKMQDDLTWGVKALVKQGIADGKRVGIMGGSYGGYATLAGVAFTPDVYAAGVSIVGPSNLLTLLETIPPYWEPIRVMFHTRMGDPGTPAGKARLQRQSPLNSAARIKTPLLVVQGANDPRVKKAESEQIVIALRDRGFPVGYLLAPDEGHGFQRPVNNMAMFAAAEAFLAQHLKARFQEGGTPEVVSRLRDLTVDPRTVVLAPRVDAAAVGTPRPTSDLAPATVRYAGTVSGGGQSMPITISRTTVEQGGAWSISETTTLAQGDSVEHATLEKGTLVPLTHSIKQGPVSVELTFEGAKVSGTMSMGDKSRPVAVDLGGQAFADGPGSDDVLARLPLAEGYQVTFRNLDLRRQKPTLKQLKVLGAEEVKVAAGTFKAWKAEVTSAEGEPGSVTLWVAQDSRRVVKLAAVLAEMGGAQLAAELQP